MPFRCCCAPGDRAVGLVVAVKEGRYVVVDEHQKNWVLEGTQMDFPREYRYECPWLSENDPRVLQQIERQVDKMRASPYDRDSAGRSHYHEKLEYLEWLLNRNGVLHPEESDDHPRDMAIRLLVFSEPKPIILAL